MHNASGSNRTRNIGFEVTNTNGKVKVKGKATGYSYLGDWTYLTPEESSGNGRLRHYINEKTGLTFAEEELLKKIPDAKGAAKEEKINQLNKLLILKTPTRFYDNVRNKIYDSSVLYGYYPCSQFLEHGILKDSSGSPVTECPADLNDPGSLTIQTPPSSNNGSTTPRAMGGRKARKTRLRRTRVRKTRRR